MRVSKNLNSFARSSQELSIRFFQQTVATIVLILLLLVPISAAVTFYAWFEKQSYRWATEAGLGDDHANAIKHARAAYEVHQALHWMGFPNPERMVLSLGQMNEWGEQKIRSKPDSAREIMKDMSNNYAGIVAAQWRNAHLGVSCKQETIVHLAIHKALIVSSNDVVATTDADKQTQSDSNIAAALQWLDARKPVIRTQVEKQLDGCLKR